MSAVYRHFDGEGRLLYVGISLSAIKRLGDHKDHSPWFASIRRVEIEHHKDRRAAMEAERKAIVTENPVCNINLKRPPPPERPTIEATRRDLVSKIVSFKPVYKPDEAAQILLLTGSIVRALIAAGKMGHVLLPPRRAMHRGRPLPPRVAITGWQLIDYIEALEAAAP